MFKMLSRIAAAFFLAMIIFLANTSALANSGLDFQLEQNKHVMLHLENGDLLCSVLNEERSIEAIELLSDRDEFIWNTKLPEPLGMPIIPLAKKDSTGFIVSGKNRVSALFQIYEINAEGEIDRTVSLPVGSFPLALTEQGCLYTITDKEGKQALVFENWQNEMLAQSKFDGKIQYSQHSMYDDRRIFYDTSYKDQSDQIKVGIGCFDLQKGLLWHFEVGNAENWNIQSICLNNIGGVTMISQYANLDVYQTITVLDDNGIVHSQHEIKSSYYNPVAQIIQQSPDKNYRIWGSAGICNEGETYPYTDTTYALTLSSQGEYLSEECGKYVGTCVLYNGDIYVYNVDGNNYINICKFEPLKKNSKNFF